MLLHVKENLVKLCEVDNFTQIIEFDVKVIHFLKKNSLIFKIFTKLIFFLFKTVFIFYGCEN